MRIRGPKQSGSTATLSLRHGLVGSIRVGLRAEKEKRRGEKEKGDRPEMTGIIMSGTVARDLPATAAKESEGRREARI